VINICFNLILILILIFTYFVKIIFNIKLELFFVMKEFYYYNDKIEKNVDSNYVLISDLALNVSNE
jgi:hypothetical protein